MNLKKGFFFEGRRIEKSLPPKPNLVRIVLSKTNRSVKRGVELCSCLKKK
jgi:hypothetical protein